MICINDLCITFQIENLGCYNTLTEVESNRDEWTGSIVSLAASLQINIIWHVEQIIVAYRLNCNFMSMIIYDITVSRHQIRTSVDNLLYLNRSTPLHDFF